MKNVLCIRTNWINQGMGVSTMPDHRDGEGNEKFITKEGILIKDPANKASVLIRKVQNQQVALCVMAA